MTDSSGQRHTLWWHVYPLGFVGAPKSLAEHDGDPVHRLRELIGWLDHVVQLGLSGLALGPIFTSATHGYDTLDHYTVDPRLGDNDDLHALIAACHERGLKVQLDGVFNHVADTHPLFRRALDAGPNPPGPNPGETEFFHFTWPQDWQPGQRPDYLAFEGHGQLATLNHANPGVRDLIVDVMTHWLDAGVDSWRLDAAYAIPTDALADIVARVRQRHPQAYLLGEVIHGDYRQIIADTGLDSLTQYELWKAIWSSLNDRNFHELAWSLTRHNEFLQAFVPWTFIGNHDVTRIATKLTEPRALGHAVVLLLLLGGTPAVYYGDELALEGLKEDRAGGDDAVRPQLGAPPGEVDERAAHAVDLYRELIAVRRRHPWLHEARSDTVEVTNTLLCLSFSGEGEDLTVALNIDDHPVACPVTGTLVAARGVRPDDPTTLEPYGWAVISTNG